MNQYRITRERITWFHAMDSRGQVKITHPMQWLVTEDASEDCVKVCNTKREALAWVAAQDEETHHADGTPRHSAVA